MKRQTITTQTSLPVLPQHSNKKYIIRYKGMPLSRHDIGLYPNSVDEWYYCRYIPTDNRGTWRHISFIKHPIISELGGPVSIKFDKLRFNIYKDNQIELVEFTNALSQEFTWSILKNTDGK